MRASSHDPELAATIAARSSRAPQLHPKPERDSPLHEDAIRERGKPRVLLLGLQARLATGHRARRVESVPTNPSTHRSAMNDKVAAASGLVITHPKRASTEAPTTQSRGPAPRIRVGKPQPPRQQQRPPPHPPSMCRAPPRQTPHHHAAGSRLYAVSQSHRRVVGAVPFSSAGAFEKHFRRVEE